MRKAKLQMTKRTMLLLALFGTMSISAMAQSADETEKNQWKSTHPIDVKTQVKSPADKYVFTEQDEQTAKFPGGREAMKKFIADSIRISPLMAESDSQGIVVVQFLVGADGKLSQFKVVRSLALDYDKEALRVIKSMPDWIPAKKDGKPFGQIYNVAVPFKLQ